MNIRKFTIAIALFTAFLAVNLAMAATQTLTGVINDDMCGKKHTMMPGKPDSECIRACVKAGSKYALQVGEKVYTLTGDGRQFDRLAGKKVKVSGEVTGNTVAVKAIGETN
jgi:hypothetical protein